LGAPPASSTSRAEWRFSHADDRRTKIEIGFCRSDRAGFTQPEASRRAIGGDLPARSLGKTEKDLDARSRLLVGDAGRPAVLAEQNLAWKGAGGKSGLIGSSLVGGLRVMVMCERPRRHRAIPPLDRGTGSTSIKHPRADGRTPTPLRRL